MINNKIDDHSVVVDTINLNDTITFDKTYDNLGNKHKNRTRDREDRKVKALYFSGGLIIWVFVSRQIRFK